MVDPGVGVTIFSEEDVYLKFVFTVEKREDTSIIDFFFFLTKLRSRKRSPPLGLGLVIWSQEMSLHLEWFGESFQKKSLDILFI